MSIDKTTSGEPGGRPFTLQSDVKGPRPRHSRVTVTLNKTLKTEGKNMLTRLKWFKAVWVLAVLLVVCGVQPAQASPLPLIGSDFAVSSSLYDVDPATGATSNPRPTAGNLAGITTSLDGTELFGISGDGGGTLVRINPADGSFVTVGALGIGVVEGDLDFDPTTGVLWGVGGGLGQEALFSIDTTTGAIINTLPIVASDPSAMAFDAAGNLFVVGLGGSEALLQIDKTNGSTISSNTLSGGGGFGGGLGFGAGMDFDPDTGTLFIADSGGFFGSATLYTLDLSGQLTAVGPATGTPDGLWGLTFVVPEPATFSLLGLAGLTLLHRRRRQRD